MASIDLTVDASIPPNSSVKGLVEEDTNGDGVAENRATITLSNGTNTYSPSGFDASSGNDYRVFYDAATPITEGVSINSWSVTVSEEFYRSTTLASDGAVSATRASMTKTRTGTHTGEGAVTTSRTTSKSRSSTLIGNDGIVDATRLLDKPRTTIVSDRGAISNSRSGMTKNRTATTSNNGTVSSTRSTTKSRSSTLVGADGRIDATRLLDNVRSTTISGEGRFTTYASFQKAFRTTRYLDWEYSSEKSGFVSEWVDETKVHQRNGAVGAYVEGWIGDDPVSLQIEYSKDGETVDERSGVRYILGANRVETFESLSGDEGYYRIILRYLRLDDNIVEVNLGLTHT